MIRFNRNDSLINSDSSLIKKNDLSDYSMEQSVEYSIAAALTVLCHCSFILSFRLFNWIRFSCRTFSASLEISRCYLEEKQESLPI